MHWFKFDQWPFLSRFLNFFKKPTYFVIFVFLDSSQKNPEGSIMLLCTVAILMSKVWVLFKTWRYFNNTWIWSFFLDWNKQNRFLAKKSWPVSISYFFSARFLKGYLPNLLESALLPRFFVFEVRDFKVWLFAYFLIFFNCAKFQ